MAANPYPNLGWNPVPGIPAEVTSLQRKVGSAATALDNCHKQLDKLLGESSYWQGDAAEEFRDAIDGDLPKYIKKAAESLQKASTQLKNWDGHLTSNRDLAQKYDADAGEKKAAAAKAKGAYEQAGQHPDLKLAGQQFPSQDEADAATARLRAAEKSMNEAAAALEKANTAYNDITQKAKALETQHADQADTIAKALDGATDKLAPKEGFWSKVGNVLLGCLNFLKDHAGTIGAICGLLALFPTPFAPLFAGIAIVASGTSMAKNFTDAGFRDALFPWGDKFGWNMETFSAYASFGGDALGMVPGGKALGAAAKEIGEGIRYADDIGVAVKNTEKTWEFVKEFGHVLKTAPKANADEAWDAARASAGGSGKLMADININGLNVAANIESSLETLGVVPKEGSAHNASEITKAGAGAYAVPDLVSSFMR
ncbi:putative T7SS-secreted protein [Streptomyces flavidovirens]|uniref:putative T7SS-secreted protein n=1 Tax=Streptomyces flavidovirens TaxID=67298 RepID=UPI003448CC0B